jgi:hypothetical protein
MTKGEHMKRLVLSSLLSTVTFVAGCATGGQTNQTTTKPPTSTTQQPPTDSTGTTNNNPFPQDKNNRLIFFPAREADINIAYPGKMPPLDQAGENNSPGNFSILDPGTDDTAYNSLATSDYKNGVSKICGGTAPDKKNKFLAPVAIAILGWVIEKVATWVVDETSNELQKAVNKYTITYAASANSIDFYKTLSNGRGLALNGKGDKQVACYRYSIRGPADPSQNSNPTLLLDFIGSINYDPSDPREVTLRPVRIYVRRVSPPTSSDSVKVQIKLSATAMALANGSVQYSSQAINNVTVLAVDVDTTKHTDPSQDIEKKPFYQVYDDTAPSVHVQLPNWDASGGSTRAISNGMDFTVSVAEIGTVPKFLDELNSIVSKNKDAATKDLEDGLGKWSKSAFKLKAPPPTT